MLDSPQANIAGQREKWIDLSLAESLKRVNARRELMRFRE
jgi:hypothetical protein